MQKIKDFYNKYKVIILLVLFVIMAVIPFLGIETDYTDADAEQLRTRVEAFVEMLG